MRSSYLSSSYFRSSFGRNSFGEAPAWPPAVNDLAAEAGNGTTTLTWTEVGEFDSVNIYRDGVLYDNVTAGVGTWTSGAMEDGLYEWVLAPVTGGVEGNPTAPLTFGCMTGDVWVDADNGSDSNDGAGPDTPVATLRKAGSLVTAAGMRVVVRGGVYSEYNTKDNGGVTYGSAPVTTYTQDGQANNYNEFRSFPGEKVIIDGSSIKRPLGPEAIDANRPELFSIMGDYWLVSGWPGPDEDPMAYAIEIRNSAGCGFRSRLTTGVRALYIDSHSHEGSAFNMQECDDWEIGFSAGWDVYSTVNDGESADGVSGANGSGAWVHDSVFLWCGDDGIDVFNGTNMLVENNVVYKAGYFPNGVEGNGNGNGIKMGSPVHDDPLGNTVRNNIVVGCTASGLTANAGWGIDCYHNTAIGNLLGFTGREGGDTVRFIHNVAYNNGSAKLIDNAQGTKPLESYNSWNNPPNPTVTSDDFENLTFDEDWRSVAQVHTALYAKLTSGSDLKGAGENGEDLGYEGLLVPATAPVLTLTPGYKEIHASWTTVLGATKYRYRIDGGSWTETSGTSHTFTGLTNGVNYTIDVQAGNDGGDWSASATDTAAPVDEVTPSEVTLTIADGLHDGYADGGGFSNNLTQLAGFGDSCRMFLYWALPAGLTPGSEIVEAKLSLVPRNPETAAGSAFVQAHDVDNAAVPTSWSDIAAWDDQLTTASVQWDVPAFNSDNYGTRLWSPDIKDVVQEIVDRVGFEEENAILFILMPNAGPSGEKYFYSYEYTSNVRPQLYIKWIPAS